MINELQEGKEAEYKNTMSTGRGDRVKNEGAGRKEQELVIT